MTSSIQLIADQQAIRDSEARYRKLVDEASDAILISDRDGRFLDANESAVAMLGYAREELLGMQVRDLVPPEDMVGNPLRYPGLRPGDATLVARRIQRSDRHILQVEISLKVLQDGRVQSIIRDVSDRERVHKRLLEIEARFNLLAAATLDAIYDWDVAGDAIWWNENFERFFGAVVGMPRKVDWWIDRIHPDDRQRTVDAQNASFARGDEKFVSEYRFRLVSGEYAHVYERGWIVRDGGENVIRMIGSMVDLTDRVRAEEALRRSEAQVRNSEERFRALVEQASDMIAVLDENGTLTYEAPSIERILGYTAEERIGQSPFALVHPADRERVMCEFQSALARGAESHRAEFRMQHKDGSWRHIESIGRSLLHHPAVRGIVVNSRDLTERKMIEEQLEKAQRLSSLGNLAATIAHEFNNVLMGVQPFAEVIKRHASTDPAIAVASEHIQNCVKRGRRITQEILRFTQPSEPVVQDIDVQRWLGEMETELAGVLGRDHSLLIAAEPRTFIRGDAAQLTQVLFNLVLNARDAMTGRKGLIAIRATIPRRDASYSFGVVPAPHERVHLTVSDTGSGIPPNAIDRIFDPLFTTKRSGTGLGLSVARQVIARHDGQIFVESEPGKGSSFHIFLPRGHKAEEILEPAPQRAAQPSARRRRVLLVEDDASVAAGLTSMLELDGFAVQVVADAVSCFSAVRAFQPDIVVLDVGLPDMDGAELFSLIDAEWPRLPVVFSTGHADEKRLAGLLRRPDVAFLQKPYDVSALIDVFDRFVPAARD